MPFKPKVAQGRLLQEKRLKQGGKLLVIPFKAGVGVAANAELDRLALQIVKGIADTFKKQPGSLHLVFDQDAGSADMVVRGHIVQQRIARVFKNGWWRKDRCRLAVEGRLIDAVTQDPVLTFSLKREGKTQDNAFDDLAYMLGADIAYFILNPKP